MKAGAGTYAHAIYAAYPKKKGKVAALQAIAKALHEVEYETLLLRTQAFAVLVEGKRGTKDWDFVPYPATWFNKGCWDDEEVLAECSPGKRLKVLFEAWWEKVQLTGYWDHVYDYHERRYIWLHLCKLNPQLPADLHSEAGDQYQWSVRQYGSIYAGEASADIMDAVGRLADA